MIISIIKKVLQSLFSQKLNLLLILIVPILVTVLLVPLFNNPKYNFGVVNLDAGSKSNGKVSYVSKTLIDSLKKQTGFNWIVYKKEGTAKLDLDSNRLVAYVVIPSGFSQTFTNQTTPHLSLYTGNSTVGASDIVYNTISQLFVDKSSVNQSAASIITTSYPFKNASLNTNDQLVPEVVVFIVSMFTLLITAFLFLKEKQSGFIARLKGKKTSLATLTAGYFGGYFILSFLLGMILLVVAKVIFKLSFIGNVGSIILVLALVCAFFVLCGMLISLLFNDSLQVLLLSVVFFAPQLMFSGILRSVNAFPDVGNKIISALPLENGVNVMNSIALEGETIKMYPWHLVFLLGYTVIFFALVMLGFKYLRED